MQFWAVFESVIMWTRIHPNPGPFVSTTTMDDIFSPTRNLHIWQRGLFRKHTNVGASGLEVNESATRPQLRSGRARTRRVVGVGFGKDV